MNVKPLRTLLVDHFNLDELHDLCFDLDVNFENLAGATLDSKARELIAYCQRRQLLPALLAAVHQQRPHIAWAEGIQQTAAPPAPLQPFFMEKIAAAQQQINILCPADDLAGPDAQTLAQAIKVGLKADEILFTTVSSFHHDVVALLRGWANNAGLPQPPFTCIVFVDLAATSPGMKQMEALRAMAPTAVFILYTTPAEYEQSLSGFPSLAHYYKLFKKEGLALAADVRQILDEARQTAIRKMEGHIAQV